LKRLLLVSVLLVLSGCGCEGWDPLYQRDDLEGDPTPFPHPCGEDLPAGIDPDLVDGVVGAPEICNDVDDDCDGLVDEEDPDLVLDETTYLDLDGDGFGDLNSPVVTCDGEGVQDSSDCDDTDPAVHPDAEEQWADGLDSDCDGDPYPDPCEEPPPGEPAVADESCQWTSPADWFNPQQEWTGQVGGDPLAMLAVSVGTPMVGPLFDGDGDGDVDADDPVSIALVQSGNGDPVIAIYPGDGSAPPLELTHVPSDLGALPPSYHSELALADLDADGHPDIVATWVRTPSNPRCLPGAIRTDGSILWIQPEIDVDCIHHAPALADLEGDGAIEVVFGDWVLEGNSGVIRWKGGAGQGFDDSYVNSGFHSFAVDLDGDGLQEVVTGNTIYEHDGQVRCAVFALDGYPAVADLDGDGLGEVVVTGHESIRIFEHDCTLTQEWEQAGVGNGGPAVLADFDGDGSPEIGVAGRDFYVAYETDGAEMWRVETTDASSASTGSAAFDFNGDGVVEVVYADEEDLFVVDGPTGQTLLRGAWRESGTRNEYATIADVDGDGAAEILFSNESSLEPALSVVGDVQERWSSTRSVWNQHAFRSAAVGDDLSVLPDPVGGPVAPSFRQGEAFELVTDTASDSVPAADLAVEAWGACVDGWGAQLIWWVQVSNVGALPTLLPRDLVVYGTDEHGVETLLFEEEVPALDPGEAGEVTELWLWTGTFEELVSLRFVVDTAGEVAECDEANNEAVLELDFE
jgi:hypothetical protein